MGVENRKYHIAQIYLAEENLGKFNKSLVVLPKFTIQILTMSCDIDKESKQIRIHQNFTQQNFVLYGILMMALSE